MCVTDPSPADPLSQLALARRRTVARRQTCLVAADRDRGSVSVALLASDSSRRLRQRRLRHLCLVGSAMPLKLRPRRGSGSERQRRLHPQALHLVQPLPSDRLLPPQHRPSFQPQALDYLARRLPPLHQEQACLVRVRAALSVDSALRPHRRRSRLSRRHQPHQPRYSAAHRPSLLLKVVELVASRLEPSRLVR